MMKIETALVMHGSEKEDLGGPSIRIPKTAQALTEIGVNAKVLQMHDDAMILQNFNTIHVFNIWPTRSCRIILKFARRFSLKTVLSPIMLNFDKAHMWDANQATKINSYGPYRLPDVFEIFHLTDHIVFLSEEEKNLAQSLRLPINRCSVVHNPIDAFNFQPGPGNEFRDFFQQHTGKIMPRRFVLCVGRIEARKNQLTLIKALATSALSVVFIGHEADVNYARACRVAAGPNVYFLGRVPHGQILAAAYQCADIFVQVSWSEGASLAALEAAATGCKMVLTDTLANREYFGEYANYVDPGNQQALVDIIDRTGNPLQEHRGKILREHLLANFNYFKHAKNLAEIYHSVLKNGLPCRSHEGV
jgi:glycosyltransferase involved in cell wall biosynthesis